MYSVLLLLLVVVATLVALRDWRMGLFLCVLVGCVQDPVRKVTTGNPPYLILAVFPIYAAMAVRVWSRRPALRILVHYYPQILLPAELFILALLASSLQTLSYGLGMVSLIALGWSFYAGW